MHKKRKSETKTDLKKLYDFCLLVGGGRESGVGKRAEWMRVSVGGKVEK